MLQAVIYTQAAIYTRAVIYTHAVIHTQVGIYTEVAICIRRCYVRHNTPMGNGVAARSFLIAVTAICSDWGVVTL